MKESSLQSEEELKSRRIAEASREKKWSQPSFLRELFLGTFRLDLLHPFPAAAPHSPEFTAFFERFKKFCNEEIDPVEIDATGDYPPRVVEGLKEIGAFGLKIPKEYGGLGIKQQEYNAVMQYLGSVDGNIAALMSAHQSIGVPTPIKMFGTTEQKERLLPRCAKGALTAFALTEPGVGSDPARISTVYEQDENGDYILDGEKLWCTNGTLAELLVVMAVGKETGKISAFVVEANEPGVSIPHRSRFMGLRALSNAVIAFDKVRVPRNNLIGKEGAGLKIALVTLNTGRLTIPSVCLGGAKACLETIRRWASVREQWGLPVGRHETIAHMISDTAATTFAMEAIDSLASRFADIGGYDIRLEAAAAKEWNSTRAWKIVDDTMQIRGGRGYETEKSLAARGDAAIPVERIMRDMRINTIFEGSSEIMHLFIAREAVDKHLQIAGAIIDQDKSVGQKLAALPGIAAFYAVWYPARCIGWGWWPRFGEFGALATHLRFVDRRVRKLARNIFHGMVFYGAKMQRKQAFLFRAVDVGLELCVMAATISKVQAMKKSGDPEAKGAEKLADLFCRESRRKVDDWLRDMWRNDDEQKHNNAKEILGGDFAWLEEGIERLTFTDDEIRPHASSSSTEEKAKQPAPIG